MGAAQTSCFRKGDKDERTRQPVSRVRCHPAGDSCGFFKSQSKTLGIADCSSLAASQSTSCKLKLELFIAA